MKKIEIFSYGKDVQTQNAHVQMKFTVAQRRQDHLVPIRIKRCEFTNPRFERKRSILYMRKKRSKMITMIDQKWFSCFSRLDRILPYSKYKRTELRRELLIFSALVLSRNPVQWRFNKCWNKKFIKFHAGILIVHNVTLITIKI